MPIFQDGSVDQELDVIRGMPEGMARTVLISLCGERETRKKAVEMARQLLGSQAKISAMTTTSGSAKPASLVCSRCHERVEGDKQDPDACKYHPGEFELDESSKEWDSIDIWDENDWEQLEDDPCWKEDKPDGFKWSCCERNGNVEGCERGPHITETNPAGVSNLGSGTGWKPELVNDDGPDVQVLGERSSNKRKSDGDIVGLNGHKDKKGAHGYGIGIFE
ncbi:hypothetical protein CGCS363_v010561 [Colletotrichum siamense]|uniref:uncharacterized protein n=1 Tax=Colletotrichum siamense TaxID=690259 RepID=UPI0018723AA5|nr:uncharacterized protein CGCS363_v010561 [Colletotrichum siamense]KAF5492270.1 hypothetical protein CGCS363_v010561 [Colletotrichum siamense]